MERGRARISAEEQTLGRRSWQMVTSTFSLNYAHVFPGHLEGGQRIMFDNNNNNIVPLGKTLRKCFPLKKQFLKEVFPGERDQARFSIRNICQA